MAARILAVDVGSRGALALLDESGVLLGIEDMPAVPEGRQGRLTVNCPLLADLVRRWQPSRGFVEFVSSRPTDSPTSSFSFGKSRGAVEGVLGACGVPFAFITPPVWKRWANIAPGREHKDTARAAAIAHFPSHSHLFARKLDIDRAEAALVGLCGLHRENRL